MAENEAMDSDTLIVDGSPYQAKHIRFMHERADKLSADNAKLRAALRPLAECAADFYATAPGACQLDRTFCLAEARDAAEAMGLPKAAPLQTQF